MGTFRLNRYWLFLGAAFLAAWIWAAIDPVYPDDWLLENYLVFLFVPVLVGLGFYFRLSNLSYTLITLFLILHVIGSHYTYAEVPFGYTLKVWFNSDRNLYDRLVHFSFGFLLAYPVMEVFVRVTRARGFWAFYLPVELTLAFSAIYELIEWWAASAVDPEAGLAFLGAQGDVWDAQKDMALAGLGATLAMLLVFLLLIAVRRDLWREVKASFKLPHGDRPLGMGELRQWAARRLKKSERRAEKG